MDDFDENAPSIMAKPRLGLGSSDKVIFKNFRLLDDMAVRKYLVSILDLNQDRETNEASRAGEVHADEAALQHVCKWLRGRPRWAANFLEAYLVREAKPGSRITRGKFSSTSGKLIEALDRYLANFTKDPTSDRRGSFVPTKGSPFTAIHDAIREYSSINLGATLQRAVFNFAVGGKAAIFEDHEAELIQVGLAAIAVTESGSRAVLDEPIMVEAGINFFTLDGSVIRNLKNQEQGGHGEAFEKVMLPAIQRKLSSVLRAQHGTVEPLKSYRVSTMSSYGVLAVSCKDSIEETIRWLKRATSPFQFEGQVPPFCYPDDHFGPDLIFLLWDKTFQNYLVCLAQAKFREDFNQSSALRSITPSLLYFENRDRKKNTEPRPSKKLNEDLQNSWAEVKPRVVGGDKGCLRLMVQYPSYQKETAKPSPGMLADDEFMVPNPARKKQKTEPKLGWLSTISKENADGFFNGDAFAVFNVLKET